MPSGITAAIYENEAVSLRDYLMTVGRQMGYAILQRDEEHDQPVRKAEAHTDYHDEALEKARAALAEAEGWSDEKAEAVARLTYEQEHRAWRERIDERAALRARYEDMLAQVEAWQPDPLIDSTKEHALKYLRESIEFDCPDGRNWDSEPTPVAGPEFRDQRIAAAKHDIEYHTDERAKEIERIDERNRYIDAFLNSLPSE